MPIYNGIIQKIDEAELRRYAGLNKLKDDSMDEYLLKAAKLGRLLIRPGGVYQRYAYDGENHRILSPKPLVLKDRSIVKHLSGAVAVYVLAVTVGAELETEAGRSFEKGDYTLGVLLDAAGTTAVEQVADQLDDYLKQQAGKDGYTTTWRFSPGYGDWNLRDQQAVLDLAGGAEIGIETTSSLMLKPQKSVTAVIGIMPQDEVKAEKKGCSACGMKNCSSRKI